MICGWDGSYRQQLEPFWGCCRYGNITENERFYNLNRIEQSEEGAGTGQSDMYGMIRVKTAPSLPL